MAGTLINAPPSLHLLDRTPGSYRTLGLPVSPPFKDPNSERVRQRSRKACDSCRKYKIKCRVKEGMTDCQSCIHASRLCTFQSVRVKRDRPPTKRDVEQLKHQIRKLERVLKHLAPDLDLASLPRTNEQVQSAVKGLALPHDSAPANQPSEQGEMTLSADHVLGALKLFCDLRISSKQKSRYNDSNRSPSDHAIKGTASTVYHVARLLSNACPSSVVEDYATRWLCCGLLQGFQLPPSDLADSLIDLFFEKVNPYENLMHRGEFLRLYRSGLADKNEAFRGLCFAMFAAGSRFSTDTRVFPASAEEASGRQAAGALFLYSSISLMGSECCSCTLYDLQSMALLSYFVVSSCSPLTAWSSVASHLRRAQASRADCEDAPQWKSSIMVDQLRKKAVWYLSIVEQLVSASLGRTLTIMPQEQNLEIPLCEDEDTLEQITSVERNQSPEAAYRLLNSGLGFSSSFSQKSWRFLYRLKEQFGFSFQKVLTVRSSAGCAPWKWDRAAALKLNADMDTYFDENLPPARWDPNMENLPDLLMTARVHCSIYGLKVFTHRLLMDENPSEIATCLKASTDWLDILDHIRSRGLLELTAAWSPYLITPPTLTLLFIARSKYFHLLPMDRANAWAGVHRCISILNALAPTNFLAEQLAASVTQLVQVCVEEELFAMGAGERSHLRKRDATSMIHTPKEYDGAKQEQAATCWTDHLFPYLDDNFEEQGRTKDPEFNISNDMRKTKDNDCLTSDEFFRIPHSQLDAILYESPGRNLLPGLTSGGAPHWLTPVQQAELSATNGSYLDRKFEDQDAKLTTNWIQSILADQNVICNNLYPL